MSFFIKKILIIVALIAITYLMSGCFTASVIKYNVDKTKADNIYNSYEENIIPSKTKKNNIVGKLYIKETMKDGAIVCADTTCHYSISFPVIFIDYNIAYTYDKINSRHKKTEKPSMFYLENIDNIEFYDGLIIDITNDMSLLKKGKYTYTNDNGKSIIIPKIKIEKNYENK